MADNVTANVGPVQLKWMVTGPQADFWPSRGTANTWTGQFYSENTPMRIMAPRGTVVEGFGSGRKVVLGTIGEPLGFQLHYDDPADGLVTHAVAVGSFDGPYFYA